MRFKQRHTASAHVPPAFPGTSERSTKSTTSRVSQVVKPDEVQGAGSRPPRGGSPGRGYIRCGGDISLRQASLKRRRSLPSFVHLFPITNGDHLHRLAPIVNDVKNTVVSPSDPVVHPRGKLFAARRSGVVLELSEGGDDLCAVLGWDRVQFLLRGSLQINGVHGALSRSFQGFVKARVCVAG